MRPPRPHPRLVLVLALAAATALLAANATATLAAPRIASFERHTGERGERSIAEFWTRRRMRRAKPLEIAAPPAATEPAGSATSRGAPGHVPGTFPQSPQTALRARASAAADRRQPRRATRTGPVSDYLSYPNTTNGKLFGRMPGFGPYECSATVVRAPNRSVIFTAGHCVVDRGRRAKRLAFVPAYYKRARPFGTWVWRRFQTPRQWLRSNNSNYDYAAVTLAKREGDAVEEVVGARGLAWNRPRRQTYDVFGYPANHGRAERLWRCTSPFLRKDPGPRAPGPRANGIRCDFGVGASGGGWIVDDEFVNSVTSFDYVGQPDWLYGPYFGKRAERLRRVAGR